MLINLCRNLCIQIEVNSDGESICSRCQCKVDDDPENSKHSCRLRSDDLLRMSDDGNFCCTKCDYSTEKKINWYKHKIRHQGRVNMVKPV